MEMGKIVDAVVILVNQMCDQGAFSPNLRSFFQLMDLMYGNQTLKLCWRRRGAPLLDCTNARLHIIDVLMPRPFDGVPIRDDSCSTK